MSQARLGGKVPATTRLSAVHAGQRTEHAGAFPSWSTSHARPTVPIAVEGRNCWRRPRADRVAFLVDADAYFTAFAAAVARAQRSILITSWDIDSRTRLWHHDPPALPDTLGDFLNTVVARRRGLHAHVLNWDFAMIYAFERETLPILKLDWRTHRRLHFRLDNQHPLGASHHQKIVVVDDAIAFVGGLDVCTHRWDTPEHRAHDPRRVDPGGRPYDPFHDVQIAVDGEAAAALGDLVRERWHKATGHHVAPPRVASDPWPPSLVPDLERVAVAIARTEPRWNGTPGIREVEALFIDAIAAAQRCIYIENQYLTSARIGDALAARLQERAGPEIVIVAPHVCSGWLEESTMGVLRARLLARLRTADRHDHLRAFYPVVPHDGTTRVNVHSKVLIVDDRFARVGSANLSNRSMGLDTECDLAVEANGDPRIATAIAGFRNRLLGEHLGVDPERVQEAVRSTGSLMAAVERLRAPGRTLEPLECNVPAWLDAVIPDTALIDPERPVDAERLVAQFLPPEVRKSAHGPFVRGAMTMLILALCITLWTTLEAKRALPTEVLAVIDTLRLSPSAPWTLVAAFVVGGMLFVPLPLLILTTLIALGTWRGSGYALVGILASAAFTYVVGRLLGRHTVRTIAGRRLNRLARRLARRGRMAIAAARVTGLAPFTVTNLVAGAARIPVGDYVLGTLFAMVPAVLAIALLADALTRAIETSAIGSAAVLAGFGGILLLLGAWIGRRPNA